MMNIVVWIVQGLVALAFLLAGFMKGFAPLATLKKNMTWVNSVPAAFVRFIGIAEILGAIGLILPLATGIAPWLTVAAAIGLAIVMVSAAIFNVSRHETRHIGLNVVLLLLALFIVIARLTFVRI
jgi:uncharacterized membrane protein YphA (DoxX/SURF4 family)